jgi:chorismate dehydratase
VSENANLKSLKVARLSYLNTLPFFLDESLEACLSTSPRVLGEEAAEGRVDAGPMSLVDTWRLEADFEPLGNFGIAVKGPARSVLVFSKRPLEALGGAPIGVTDQTATSARLLDVILDNHFGVKASLRKGFAPDDQARLLIGDDALTPDEALLKEFPHTFDLGREWYLWRERPFIFARWVVRKTVPPFLKDELKDRLDASLRRFEKNPDFAAHVAAERTKLPLSQMRNYLTGFVYRLSDHDLESETLFRNLCTGLEKGCGC